MSDKNKNIIDLENSQIIEEDLFINYPKKLVEDFDIIQSIST